MDRATTRRQNTTFIAHFGKCQKFAFRSVLPFSHKSRAFVGALRMSVCPFRNPRHSEKGFSSRHIRALGQASRLRTFPGDHMGSPLRCPFRNVDYTGRSRTPPLRNPRQLVEGFSSRIIRVPGQASRLRATTWGRPYGGRTGHPQITNISLASRTSLGRAPAKRQRSAFCGKEETPALKAEVFRRKTEQLRCASTTSAAIGKRFFLSAYPRTGSRLSLVRKGWRHRFWQRSL